ncbi:oligosaccharide flippase family protein [Chitinophaga agrisoli]|uniref:Oligosaccharide flippase family protein n=1 Tax=Chitinophaga agrisoli TaxID=2607653 RepID=A0A5B2VLE8_9BACT|nr:polysaccharide biosynthesis C-terminal domain-containing protein [Chitinophaga agrisoli]KAA2239142.1 oligosaccharide flippase family protein [Chitinophaga agrisoli]
MSEVRKKSLVATVYIYIGFVFGAINIFLFSRFFLPEQYGLTRVLLDLTILFASMAALGSPTLLTKFYPYYRDRLPAKNIDLIVLALAVGTVGLILLIIGILAFKPLIIRKFSGKSPLLVDYFYMVIPLTMFLVYFTILEAHAWNQFRSVVSNLFREVVFRIANLVIIVAYLLHWISFHTFIVLFSCLYIVCFLGLLTYMLYKKELPLSFRISPLTRRLWKKMTPYVLFILGGNIVLMLSQTIDGIIISSMLGLEYTAVFALASYLCTVIVVPQRSVVSLAFPIVARAWKERDMAKLEDVYRKSSINLLLIAAFLFTIIWINFDDALTVLKLDPLYRESKPALLFLALAKIVELGTGVNGQIIITSRKWKFELYSNIILLIFMLPVNYILIKYYGLIGAGIASFLSLTLFNTIRFLFLQRNFQLQPFTAKTIMAVILPVAAYFLIVYLVNIPNPWLNIFVRSVLFVGIYAFAVFKWRISEDAIQVFHTLRGRVARMRRR